MNSHDAAARIYIGFVDKITQYIITTGKIHVPLEKGKEFYEEVLKEVDISHLSEKDKERLSPEIRYIENEIKDVKKYYDI